LIVSERPRNAALPPGRAGRLQPRPRRTPGRRPGIRATSAARRPDPSRGVRRPRRPGRARAAPGATAPPRARPAAPRPAGRAGWAASAGEGLDALFHAEIAPEGAEEPRIWAPGLARPQADGSNAPAQ